MSNEKSSPFLFYGMENTSCNLGRMFLLRLMHNALTAKGKLKGYGTGESKSSFGHLRKEGFDKTGKNAMDIVRNNEHLQFINLWYSIIEKVLVKALDPEIPNLDFKSQNKEPDYTKCYFNIHRAEFLGNDVVYFENMPSASRLIQNSASDYLQMLFWIAVQIKEHLNLSDKILSFDQTVNWFAESFAEKHGLENDFGLFEQDKTENKNYSPFVVKKETIDILDDILYDTRRIYPPVVAETIEIYQLLEDFLTLSSQHRSFVESKLGKENSISDSENEIEAGGELFDLWEMLSLYYFYENQTYLKDWEFFCVDGGNLPETLIDGYRLKSENVITLNGEVHKEVHNYPDKLKFLEGKIPDLILKKDNSFLIIDFKHYSADDANRLNELIIDNNNIKDNEKGNDDIQNIRFYAKKIFENDDLKSLSVQCKFYVPEIPNGNQFEYIEKIDGVCGLMDDFIEKFRENILV